MLLTGRFDLFEGTTRAQKISKRTFIRGVSQSNTIVFSKPLESQYYNTVRKSKHYTNQLLTYMNGP